MNVSGPDQYEGRGLTGNDAMGRSLPAVGARYKLRGVE